MDIGEIRVKYKDEWVLIEVVKCDEFGQPVEGNVIAHSRDRDDTYEAMTKTKSKYLYHTYTGKIPTKGYAVAFQLRL